MFVKNVSRVREETPGLWFDHVTYQLWVHSYVLHFGLQPWGLLAELLLRCFNQKSINLVFSYWSAVSSCSQCQTSTQSSNPSTGMGSETGRKTECFSSVLPAPSALLSSIWQQNSTHWERELLPFICVTPSRCLQWALLLCFSEQWAYRRWEPFPTISERISGALPVMRP